MVRPDKHKTSHPKRRIFAFLDGLTYDLEGLGAGAGSEYIKKDYSATKSSLFLYSIHKMPNNETRKTHPFISIRKEV
ncbi:hypothetical protein ATG71_0877 [Bacillus sp. es.034]|nr:hypothetical protein ATG71_0877 [Bacillus sp. es.034]